VLLRADPVLALECGAEREGAAVSDLGGHGADRGVGLAQQVGRQREAPPGEDFIGGSLTCSLNRRARVARETPVSAARLATVQARPGLF
jgi:hypothetical protein